MKCVIVAAGSSSRLRPLTNELPKCLLEINGRTILERMLHALSSYSFSQIIIVVGFQHKKITDAVHKHFSSLPILFVRNADYASTNNACSLYAAKDQCAGEEFLLLDSDILFNERILSLLLDTDANDTIAVRTKGAVGDEEIKVEVSPQGTILRIGKEVPLENTFGESIGMERFSARTSTFLFETLFDRLFTQNKKQEFYEASFQQMILHGASLYAVDVGNYPCMEIDTRDDLHRAKNIFR
ncbi:MAG: phosphocholine cytidylyltransferase family protein [Bacteroidetes bacterium]|nr:phosphocholine cytidylyltransferase family protein [Bacteroidota bacterium]